MKHDGVLIRPARLADALAIAGIHREAVHALAGSYPVEVLEHWAPPVELHRAERLFRETQQDGELALVAEKADAIVGFGIVAPSAGELHACYVAPHASGQGIGRALVAALEEIAREKKCRALDVRASLNAVAFYAMLGYYETRRDTFHFVDGTPMPVARMTKGL